LKKCRQQKQASPEPPGDWGATTLVRGRGWGEAIPLIV